MSNFKIHGTIKILMKRKRLCYNKHDRFVNSQ
nr:MAG TPA: hypothetical protein [Caudoviricetes sp.]